jgi:hypothetical protein
MQLIAISRKLDAQTASFGDLEDIVSITWSVDSVS